MRATSREMTTGVFLLRAVKLGISIADLELLTIGMINDMLIEMLNDGEEYDEVATQEDIDTFLR